MMDSKDAEPDANFDADGWRIYQQYNKPQFYETDHSELVANSGATCPMCVLEHEPTKTSGVKAVSLIPLTEGILCWPGAAKVLSLLEKSFSQHRRIIRVGRYYTRESLANPVPRAFKFRTRRAAKKFFRSIVKMGSTEQANSLYGDPNRGEY